MVKRKGSIKNRKWSEKATQYLKKHWREYSVHTLATQLRRTENSVINKAIKEGLVTTNTTNEWTPWETEQLQKNYGEINPTQLQKILKGRSKEAINTKARRLGLRKYTGRDPLLNIIQAQEKAGYLEATP